MDFARFQLTCFLCLVLTVAKGATVTNVSPAGLECISGAGGSFLPTFSEEGALIAFLSHANNLVTNDDSALSLDVFLAGWQSMELISVNKSRVGGGNADSIHPLVSRYGSIIVFASRSSNLTTNDTNNAVDLFVRQRLGLVSETRLITADRSGGGLVEPAPYSARPLSTHPALGADAFPDVVFQSSGTNLMNAPIADTNNASDIFIYDPDARTMRLVSIARTGDSTGDGTSHSPQFASQFIAFISTATNLHVWPPAGVATNSNRGGDIYVVSPDGETHWASPNTRNLLAGALPAPPTTYSCFNFALSGNGTVAYQANAGSDYPTVLLYCPFGALAAVRISADSDPASRPQISLDGTLVAYSSRSNVYVWNSLTQSNILISANTNGLPGNDISHSPVMDRFGASVVFVSRATDLVSNAPSGRFQIYRRAPLHDDALQLVSVSTNGGASLGDFEHSNIALPREGSAAVAFDSTASDLVVGDLNGQSDVFLWQQNETRLISRRHDARLARTAPPMSGTLLPASVSRDGRVIAFSAMDNPAFSDDTNVSPNLFIRQGDSGRLQRIASGIMENVQQIPFRAILNHSGTHLAHGWGFAAQARTITRLAWRDLNAETNVVIDLDVTYSTTPQFALSSNGSLLIYQSQSQIVSREMPAGPTNLISISYSGGPGNNVSSNVVLSPNDRWAIFQSAANNLAYFEPLGGASGFSPPPGTLYARDLLSNTSKVASITADAVVPVSGPAVFSDDSEWIAYVVTNREIYVRQIANNFRTNVCASCDQPSLSRDGSFVAYQALRTNGANQIYVKNMRNDVAKIVSANVSGGEGNGSSSAPQITADGRFVVFQSTASDLVENDSNNASDIFVGDRLLGKVLLLSINRSGSGSGNGASSKAVLSADGRTLVFQSLASDLVAGDYNDRRDVFVATLSLPDSDGDGMDDDFEITYFGNVDRGGAGDFDGDGHTDREEFIAGTNPTSDLSILRVTSISAADGTTRQIVWSATPGRTYLVQYKDSLVHSWSTLSGAIRAAASTSAVADSSSNPHRFYRVLAVD